MIVTIYGPFIMKWIHFIYDFDANFKYRDVSSNGLKGAIPSSIGRLSHLQVL
jgi:hypothetical protein